MPKYNITETRWGRYTQCVDVEIEAESEEEAMEKYDEINIHERGVSTYDYDCDDGDEVKCRKMED